MILLAGSQFTTKGHSSASSFFLFNALINLRRAALGTGRGRARRRRLFSRVLVGCFSFVRRGGATEEAAAAATEEEEEEGRGGLGIRRVFSVLNVGDCCIKNEVRQRLRHRRSKFDGSSEDNKGSFRCRGRRHDLEGRAASSSRDIEGQFIVEDDVVVIVEVVEERLEREGRQVASRAGYDNYEEGECVVNGGVEVEKGSHVHNWMNKQ
uniref:Uncharacterized protein n=1 Tax=Pristionchus pacificus TaxID=54126 RepID=A0A2A6CFI5_PRIPA|eukprot:PDM76876.1 hypothetical protein PRIPAC_42271 [Pristionchus pacificus]